MRMNRLKHVVLLGLGVRFSCADLNGRAIGVKRCIGIPLPSFSCHFHLDAEVSSRSKNVAGEWGQKIEAIELNRRGGGTYALTWIAANRRVV